jgi:NitT/TauT family transport system permease protein
MSPAASPPIAEIPATTVTAPPSARRWSTGLAKPFRPALWLLAVVALGCLVWEGYKAFGRAFDDKLPLLGWGLPVATDDISLPHVWNIAAVLFEPATRGRGELLLVNLLGESLVTIRETMVGLAVATVLGLVLALAFLLVKPLADGLLPWVIASQTVPLVAIAPMIVVWGGNAGLPGWVSVAGIAAYLAFFPITIQTLRGLSAADPTALELMRSAGASEAQSLRLLRFPNALPYVFTGLRLAATASVVGAIVGELSAGTGQGLGRAILNFSYYYSIWPEKLYAAVVVAALTGLVLVGLVWLVELRVLKHRRSTA